MTDLWCRKINCIHIENCRGTDRDGSFGECNVSEITIDRNGKCGSYEESKNGKD